jgi:hypothetical protein
MIGDKCVPGGIKMLSSLVACKEQKAHITFLKFSVNSALFRIALTLPYKVANFLSILPFCCGESGAVNSNLHLNLGDGSLR